MVAKSGSGWQLAPALVDLIDEVDERWPKRKHSSDGSIGDTSHAARASEHNPDRDPDPMPRGYVSALDITKDSAEQIEELRKKLIADPRVWYVIHDGTIWSRTYGFKPRKYTGSNPHRVHLHVSLMQTGAGAKGGKWGLGPVVPPKPEKQPAKPVEPEKPTVEPEKPTVKPAPEPEKDVVRLPRVVSAARGDSEAGWPGDAPNQAKRVELALVKAGLLEQKYADGLFGTKTVEAYAAWQRSLGFRGVDADGIPGLESLRRLGVKFGNFVTRED